MYYVYLIKSVKYNEIYIGSTNNLKRRIDEHNEGIEFSTRRYKPWELVYYEAYRNENEARQREQRLKHHGNGIRELKKRLKFSLINGAGFTLIEVLVAATIIGLLSTIGFGGFQAISRSGRDALRKTDLEQIRSALEIFKSEKGYYPTSGSCSVTDATFVPTYINTYPVDSKSPSYRYCYVRVTTLTYYLCAHLENGDTTDYSTECGGANACTSNCNYKVANP